MQFIQNNQFIAALIGTIVLVGLFIGSQYVYIMFNGSVVPAPDIPRQTQSFGAGDKLVFAVIGDSTSIGQGADYEQSIAVQSALYVAKKHSVELTNFGISGATTQEVLTLQAKKAATLSPDVVLIAVGANDVTKFSNYGAVERDMRALITTLKKSNPEMMIIMTGSPQVGSVSRFPWAVKQLAKYRVNKINQMFDRIAREETVVRLRLAERTGDLFLRDPTLFAADKFHPNNDGYAAWQPIINESLSKLQ